MTMKQPRDDNGQYVSLEKFVMSIMDERFESLRKELSHSAKALELQAEEYERRLAELNHAHARAQEVQHTFLSIEKYEDQTKAADQARELALVRVNEKVDALDQSLNEKLKPLQEFRARALGFTALVALVSGVIGSVVTALILGAFG